MPTPEATLRATVLADIRRTFPRRTGVLVFGRPASGSTGPGHPDLFGVVCGRFLALELKTRTGRVTLLQRGRIIDLRSCGACAWVVRSSAEARAAIKYTLAGGQPPMSDEPIDFNAWLSGLGEPATPQPPFPPPVIPPMPPSFIEEEESSALPWDDQPVVATGRTPQAEAFFEEIKTPEYQEKLNNIPPAKDPRVAKGEAEFAAVVAAEEAAAVDGVVVQAELLKLDMDVRTVGDRVTLVYEQINGQQAFLNSSVHRLIDICLQLQTKVDNLLSQIEVVSDEAPPTGLGTTKRQRRKKAEPAPEPEVILQGEDLLADAEI